MLMRPNCWALIAAVLATATAGAGEPPCSDRKVDLGRLEGLLRPLTERLQTAATKLTPEALQAARTWGRYEALLAEAVERRRQTEVEALRLADRRRALEALPELEPATLKLAAAAADQVQAHGARLAKAEALLRQKLAEVKNAYVNRVLRGALAPVPLADEPLLREVEGLLAPAPAATSPTRTAPKLPVCRPVRRLR